MGCDLGEVLKPEYSWGRCPVATTMPAVLNLTEAAQYLRLKPRTLCALALRGAIPATKIGGQWRFQSQALEVLFAAQAPRREAGRGAAAAAP